MRISFEGQADTEIDVLVRGGAQWLGSLVVEYLPNVHRP